MISSNQKSACIGLSQVYLVSKTSTIYNVGNTYIVYIIYLRKCIQVPGGPGPADIVAIWGVFENETVFNVC